MSDTMYLLPERSITTIDHIFHMDALSLLRALPAGSVDCVVTSPPYYALRDYGVSGQIGLEDTPVQFIERLMQVFREVRRILKPTGTCWVNLGDSYSGGGNYRGVHSLDTLSAKQRSNGGSQGLSQALGARDTGLPPKSLMMIPARFAIAMQDEGWILRSDIIWSKRAPMPESVTDRPSKAHEHIYFFAKETRYYYDQNAVREPVRASTIDRYKSGWNGQNHRGYPGGQHNNFDKFLGTEKAQLNIEMGRNMRDVWHLSPEPTGSEHFAAYPTEIPRRCILAGCPRDGVVLDMFMGTGTTAVMARKLGRHYIGCDLNPEYVAMARRRLAQSDPYQHRQVGELKQLSMFAGIAL